jgi:hypothetical protein
MTDIGVFVAWQHARKVYSLVLQVAERSGRPIVEIERELHGASHAFLGAEVLTARGLPDAIILSIRYHHGGELDRLDEPDLDIAKTVYVAAAVAELFCGGAPADRLEEVRDLCRTECGLQRAKVEELLNLLDKKVKEMAASLSLDIGETVDYDALQMDVTMMTAALSLQANDSVRSAKQQEEETRAELEKREVQAAKDILAGVWNRPAILGMLERESRSRQAWVSANIQAKLAYRPPNLSGRRIRLCMKQNGRAEIVSVSLA